MSHTAQLPRWIKWMNRLLIMPLNRLGLTLGTMRVLSVPGRVSGTLRPTPVSPLTVDGKRYVVGGKADADWVKNARAAGWGTLAAGRKQERVTLIELPVNERSVILRAFPLKVPHGVPFFRQLYELPHEPAALPDAFAALAPHCVVFRIEALVPVAVQTPSPV